MLEFNRPLDEVKKYFFDRVVAAPSPDKCLMWQGSIGSDGYGLVNLDYRVYRAHRVSYLIFYGDVPGDKVVMHKCDNPPCVNPLHLALGSHKDNARDRDAKNRRKPATGEKHGRAKLTAAAVVEIRRRCAGGESQGRVADSYGVSKQVVSRIVQGEIWKTVS